MQILFCLSTSVFLCANLLVAGSQALERCLPTGIKLTDVASTQATVSGSIVKKITVEQKLAELKASCRKGKLVDSAGKEIRFYRLEGCWGNPPEGYQEILRKQSDDLAKMRKQYAVIEITCDPDGVSPH